MALSSGVIWGWYVAKCAFRSELGRQSDAVGNLVAGAVLIYLSWLVETPWEMTRGDVYWLCGLIIVENAGFWLWVYGARYGDRVKAKIGALFTPAGALIWLGLLGGFVPSAGHIAATIAVSLAGLMLSPYVFRTEKKVHLE